MSNPLFADVNPGTPKFLLKTLFSAIGELAVTWAYLEIYIDKCIDAICEHCGGSNLGIELPRTYFARKIEFIRKWHNIHSIAATVLPSLQETLTTISEGSAFRNSLIHSVVVEMEHYEATGLITVFQYHRDKKRRNVEKVIIGTTTVKQIRSFGKQTLAFATFFAALHNRLVLGISPDDEPIKPNG
jgi:hypothetical protein